MAKKILIVDDEHDIVRTLENRLKANGYDVISSYDGQDAMDKVKSEPVDLMILDLMLPKLDGYKVCGLLKRNKKYHNIPIIMFTAKAKEEDAKLGKELGADAYIVKPFNPQVLLAKIKELLKE